jgi:hypothetical protein
MGSFPSAANELNTQQPSPLEAYGKIMQLKSLMQGQQLQQAQLQGEQQQQKQSAQLFPGQLQQQNVQTQMAQNKLASQNAMIKAWQDPGFSKEITGGGQQGQQSNGPGFDPNAMTQSLVKRGVMPEDAMAMTNQFVDRSAKVSEMVKNNAAAASDQIGTYQKALGTITDKLSSIMDMPVSKAGPAFDAYKQELARNPIPGIPQGDLQALQSSTLDKLPSFVNMATIEGKIADYHKQEADAQIAQQKVIPASGGLSPEAKQGLQADIAKTTNPQVMQAEAQKAAMSQEAVQKALYGGSPLASVPPALIPAVTADATKVDQAYTQAQQAGNEMQSMVDLAKKGNKVAYAYSPVTGVLQINVAGQIKRMNMPEIESYGSAGSAMDRIKGFLGKQTEGKSIPDDVLNDMSSVSQMVTQGARTKYESDINGLNSRYGSKFQPMAAGGPSNANPQSSGPAKDLGAAPQGAKEGETGKFNGVPAKIVNGRIVAQ